MTIGQLIGIQKPEYYWLVMDKEKLEALGINLLNKFIKKPEKFDIFLKDCAKQNKQFRVISSAFEQVDLRACSDIELIKWYNKFRKKAVEIFSLFFPLCESICLIIRGTIKKLIEQHNQLVNDKQFDALISPNWKSYIQEAEENITLIADMINKKKPTFFKLEPRKMLAKLKVDAPEIYNLLERHTNLFWFSYSSYQNITRADSIFFIKLLKHMKNNQQLISSPKKNKKALLKSIKASKELITCINVLDKTGAIHDQRKSIMIRVAYYFKQILDELGNRRNMTFDQLTFLRPEEIIEIAKNKNFSRLKMQQIIKNHKNSIVTFNIKGTKILTGIEARKEEKKFFQFEQKNTLKGTSAAPGSIKGIVKIILSIKDKNKLKKGEILVTSHTTPDWIVIMKKAKAILTERGGITSHAAIVSRELNIPCIVGIRNVTAQLKDGQLIEVDADKNKIKIIKQS